MRGIEFQPGRVARHRKARRHPRGEFGVTDAHSRKTDAAGNLPAEPSEADKAAERQSGQFAAARIAGELFALPKGQRMAALIQMPVDDRIALTSYVGGDQRNQLLADFSPKEREIFLGMAAGIGAQYQIGQELSQAKMVRAIVSERPGPTELSG